MRAAIFTRYGPPNVLQVGEVKKPAPKDDEVLIRVHAATVTAGDCEVRRFDIPALFWIPARLLIGVFSPRIQILGQELAGEVESVGKNVTTFKPGDGVFAAPGFGAYAEYVCVRSKDAVALKPTNLSFEEAAGIPIGGLNALHFLRQAKIAKGQKVLIYGSTGSIGTVAVQLARHYGAEVTAVCNTRNFDLVRSLGATKLIDYTQEDFTANGETYDVIFDTVGKSPFARSLESVKSNGFYLLANPGLSETIRGLWTSMTGSKTVVVGLAGHRAEDLLVLKGLIEAGEIRPVIDRRYPLERIAEAHAYVEMGQKTGNVIIDVA